MELTEVLKATNVTHHKIGNIDLYYKFDDRVKSIIFKLENYMDYDFEERRNYAVLERICNRVSKSFPTTESFAYELEELYYLNYTVGSYREFKSMTFSNTNIFISPKFVKEDNYLDKIIDFIYNSYFNPYFDEKLIAEEVENIIVAKKNEKNNPTRCASKAFSCIFYKGEITEKIIKSDVNDLYFVTKDDCYRAYQKIISCPMVMYVTGNLDPNIFVEALNKKNFDKCIPLTSDFKFKNYNNCYKIKSPYNLTTDYRKLNQAIIFIGFKNEDRSRKSLKEKISASLFAQMYSNQWCSDLMQILRIEKGLVYDVSCNFEGGINNLVVVAKTRNENVEEVINTILAVFNNYKEGIFDENNLNIAKINYINGLKQSEDFAISSIQAVKGFIINGNYYSKELQMNTTNEITINDIKSVVSKYSLDTVYTLMDGDTNEKDN